MTPTQILITETNLREFDQFVALVIERTRSRYTAEQMAEFEAIAAQSRQWLSTLTTQVRADSVIRTWLAAHPESTPKFVSR